MENFTKSEITDDQLALLLSLEEDHFKDLKAKEILPGKLSRTISAFANAVGGEIYLGIREVTIHGVEMRQWDGFGDPEDANAHIQTIESLLPLSNYCSYQFLSHSSSNGLILYIQVEKTKEIVCSSDGTPYIRKGAQNLPVDTPEKLERLRLDKGIESFEARTINVGVQEISDSDIVYEFLIQVLPTTEPEPWLRKQLLINSGLPTVAGILLFSDEPQAILPKRSGIKLFRYSTKGEAARESLVGTPETIEGPLYYLIYKAVDRTIEIIEAISVLTKDGMTNVTYPRDTLHEIIANAVLHRDYSIAADVQIRIFDNRIEVESPGRLPGHVTIENILKEQLARNGRIVRLVNKFPNPPNKDVGEGLNTAFGAMERLRFKVPIITELDNAVLVVIRHESLASAEDIVLEYLKNHSVINNRTGRELTGIRSENSMKDVFKRLQARSIIQPVEGLRGAASAWELVSEPSEE